MVITNGDIEHYELCKVVGVLLHWSLLSQQIWCSIVSFDFFYVFKVNFNYMMENRSKHFKCYCLVGWSLPTIVVVVLCCVDTIFNNMMQYGVDGVCWIGEFWASIGAYVIPTAACLLFNIILFSITFPNLHSRIREGIQIGIRQASTDDIGKIATKMALLVGLFEVIGLIQIPCESKVAVRINHVVSFIYSCLRSVRGILIFLCFICRKRILNLYKGVTTKMAQTVSQRYSRSFRQSITSEVNATKN